MRVSSSLKIFLFLIFSISLKSCRKDPIIEPVVKGYDVVLIVGQSNNYFGEGLDALTAYPISENIKQLGRKDSLNYQLIPAIDPLQNHTLHESKGSYSLTFAKYYEENVLQKPNKLLLVPCAMYGSSFKNNQWHKGDDLYEDAVLRVNYILEHYKNSEVKAILCHQGESDVGNPEYVTALDSFIINLRADIGNSEIPFILGGMVPFWVKQKNDRINQQNNIKDTPSRVAYTRYVDPEIPFVIEKPDNSVDSIHYSALGLRELGFRYYKAYTTF